VTGEPAGAVTVTGIVTPVPSVGADSTLKLVTDCPPCDAMYNERPSGLIAGW
jgi:hypothetical protein